MKLYIQNCENPDLIVEIGYVGEQESFPLVANLGISSFFYVDSSNIVPNLCLPQVVLNLGEDDITIESLVASQQGTYNGKPYYAFQVNHDSQNYVFYILWNSTDEQWEAWESFDGTTPSCPTFCDCESAGFPFLHYSEENLEDEGTWIPNENLCGTGILRIDPHEICESPAIIQVQNQSDCWTLHESPEDLDILGVVQNQTATEEQIFEDCEECLAEPLYMVLTNCQDESNTYYTQEYTEDMVGKTFKIDDNQCYSTTETSDIEGIDILPESAEFSEPYEDCAECLPTPIECETVLLYTLQPCDGGPNIYINDDLLDIVSLYIRIPFLDDRCFRVLPAQHLQQDDYYTTLPYEGPFQNCLDCLPRPVVEPVVPSGCCSIESIANTFCKFTDVLYRRLVGKKYGISTTEKGDFENAYMKYKAVEWQSKCLVEPPLRTPKPEVCCIHIDKPCVPVSHCVDCDTAPTEILDEQVGCVCDIAMQDYTCHRYETRVTANRLSLATGNDNEWLNGRVFFAFYPCGEYEVHTKNYTKPSDIDECVIGEPLFGYFRDNVFVEINTSPIEVCKQQPKNCK